MIVFANCDEGTEVINLTASKCGSIKQIRSRRPAMALVAWSDGTEIWCHPEQLSLPCSQLMPPPQEPIVQSPITEAIVPHHDERRRILIRVVSGGSITAKEAECFGCHWPPKKGWKKRLLRELRLYPSLPQYRPSIEYVDSPKKPSGGRGGTRKPVRKCLECGHFLSKDIGQIIGGEMHKSQFNSCCARYYARMIGSHNANNEKAKKHSSKNRKQFTGMPAWSYVKKPDASGP